MSTSKGRLHPEFTPWKEGRLRLCTNIFGDPSYLPEEFKTREVDGAGYAMFVRAQAA